MIDAKKQNWKKILKSSRGFSLIEILIGLTLLGIIATFVGSKVFDMLEQGRKKASVVQMGQFASVLERYRLDCGSYPTTEQGLDSLVTKPSTPPECKTYNPKGYLDGENVPDDPWGFPYVYESDGSNFDIISQGPNNGNEGGEGEKAPVRYSEAKGKKRKSE